MEIKVIQEPKYKLTLTAEEMSHLWKLLYDAKDKYVDYSGYFFNRLEDVRPAGGFKGDNKI